MIHFTQFTALEKSINEPLEKSINELEEKFLEVVLAIQLDCKCVDIRDIKICLTLIPQEHKSFLMKHTQDIAHASSVIEIITLLNCYWDCFNYGLLERLVEQFGCNQTKYLMKQFVRDVNVFMENTKLADFMCICRGGGGSSWLQPIGSTSRIGP